MIKKDKNEKDRYFVSRTDQEYKYVDELNMLLLYPGEQYAASSQSVILTNEWKEYSFSLSKGTAESFIQMWTYEGEYFIDDIKISAEGLSAPQNPTVSKYMGTSAELSWDAVAGADSYLLNVYYFSMDTWAYVYLLQNEPVTGTTYTIDGLNPSESYFFDVAAVQGDKVSPLSESVSIVSPIEAPTALPATNYSATSFTANWEAGVLSVERHVNDRRGRHPICSRE